MAIEIVVHGPEPITWRITEADGREYLLQMEPSPDQDPVLTFVSGQEVVIDRGDRRYTLKEADVEAVDSSVSPFPAVITCFVVTINTLADGKEIGQAPIIDGVLIDTLPGPGTNVLEFRPKQ